MPKFTLSQEHNPNYVASVAEIKILRPHPNADKLQIALIAGNSVVVGLDQKIGDIGIYFPLECQISEWFLSEMNLYSDSSLNADITKKGYFTPSSRVKAVRLRQEPSEGIWISEQSLPFKLDSFNGDFDTVDDKLLVKKYTIKRDHASSPKIKSDKKVVNRFDKLVENQFRLHVDTLQLKKNVHQLNLNDHVGIHYKKHGTSWVVSNCLTNKKLNWLEKIAIRIGISVQTTKYDIVFSSRNVIKNRYININQSDGYYSYDLWQDISDKVKDILPKNYTLYGEAVGYLPTGRGIQGKYDYGCDDNTYKIYVYRITVTNPDGKVIELDDMQIKEFCDKNGLLYSDTFMYYGTVYDLYVKLHSKYKPSESISYDDRDWRDTLIALLQLEYTEKDCYMCKNKLPEEGVVIRKQKLYDYQAFKLKSFRFFNEIETPELDKGIVDIESEN